MKQPNDFIRNRVNTCEVRTLPQVATMAGQREVVQFIGSTMLLRNDVLKMVSKRTVLLPQKTIFAAISGPLTDQTSQLGIRHGCEFELSLRCAFSLRIAMKSAALIRAS